jgi:hypothetical protein
MKNFRIRFEELSDIELRNVYSVFQYCDNELGYFKQKEIYLCLKDELKFLGEDFLNSVEEIMNDKGYNTIHGALTWTSLSLYCEMAARFHKSV